MSKFLRLLLFAPMTFSSVLSLMMVANPAGAEAKWVNVSKDLNCAHLKAHTKTQLVCRRVGAQSSDVGKVIDFNVVTPNLASKPSPDRGANNDVPDVSDLTDEESDVAVALFGCDCPNCIRSLRQLRSMTM